MKPMEPLNNLSSSAVEKLKIIIEYNGENYKFYADKIDSLCGYANTVQAAKQSALKEIDVFKSSELESIPSILQNDYELIFKYDIVSFLNLYHAIFTNAAFERMTGINQKQISHYAKSLKKPRKAQVKRFEVAIHILSKELMGIEL